jgi:ubiquinone/menaquinone biosynthesis C-methylase UbiE
MDLLWYHWVLACALGVGVLARVFRARIYDLVIVGMTRHWYREVLIRLGEDHHLLDVGVGTGSALLANAGILETSGIKVTGVDYDSSYVQAASRSIARRGVGHLVSAVHASVYDYGGARASDSNMAGSEAGAALEGHRFDSAYFSGSLMIMPDPVGALLKVSSLLRPQGLIYLTQTFQTKQSKWLEVLKPLLKYLTTIDFGQVTYEADFLERVKEVRVCACVCVCP